MAANTIDRIVRRRWTPLHWGALGAYPEETTPGSLHWGRERRIPGCEITAFLSVRAGRRFRAFGDLEEAASLREEHAALLCDSDRVTDFIESAEAAAADLDRWTTASEEVVLTDPLEAAALLEQARAHVLPVLAHYQLPSRPGGDDVIARVRRIAAAESPHPGPTMECILAGDLRSTEWYRRERAALELLEHWAHDGDLATERIMPMRNVLGLEAETDVERWCRDEISRSDHDDPAETIAEHRSRFEQLGLRADRADEWAAAASDRLRLSADDAVTCRSLARLGVLRLALKESITAHTRHRDRAATAVAAALSELAGFEVPSIHLTTEELVGALRSSSVPSAELLVARATAMAFFVEDETTILSGDDAAPIAELALLLVDHDRPARLEGEPVTPPKVVVGRASVIWATADLTADAVRGRIVILDALRPAIVARCKGAAAVVAEQGGPTSHAAVLTRELGIPCVVGVEGARNQLAHAPFAAVSTASGKVLVVPDRFVAMLERRANEAVRPATVPSTTERRLDRNAPDTVDLRSAPMSASIVGGKASTLMALGRHTPEGFVITTPFIQSCLGMAPHRRHAALLDAVAGHVGPSSDALWAVRSSHALEDGPGLSYAGMFRSILRVGPDAGSIAEAVWAVASSAEHVEVPAGDGRAMAVLVQRMVEPEWSGVLVTGERRRGRTWVRLDYVLGHLGALLQGAVAPFTATWAEQSWRANPREVALPPLISTQLEQVVDDLHAFVVGIADMPSSCEIEWGHDGERTWLFQHRAW